MPEVVRSYVKNQGLGFTIPYTIDGQQRAYVPDFIARIDDGHGADDLLNLIIEVSGARPKDKERRSSTARDLWIPAVNNHGGFGRWAVHRGHRPVGRRRTLIEAVVNDVAGAPRG